jgi:hypothetical protein
VILRPAFSEDIAALAALGRDSFVAHAPLGFSHFESPSVKETNQGDKSQSITLEPRTNTDPSLLSARLDVATPASRFICS